AGEYQGPRTTVNPLTAQTCRFLRLDAASFSPTVVRSAPRAWAGTHAAAAALAAGRPGIRSSGGTSLRRRKPDASRCVVARTRCADRGAVAISGSEPLRARSPACRSERPTTEPAPA